jgi:hypothetical protein
MLHSGLKIRKWQKRNSLKNLKDNNKPPGDLIEKERPNK